MLYFNASSRTKSTIAYFLLTNFDLKKHAQLEGGQRLQATHGPGVPFG